LAIFLGAGASIGAKNTEGRDLPTAYELRNELWLTLKHDKTKPFNPAHLKLMTLEHAAGIIETQTYRLPISEFLVKRFKCEKPLWQHVALPYLNPRSLFTTNYDELIELGYKHYVKQLDIIRNDRTPMPDRTVLYKPHGSISHANQKVGQGGLVITQLDYLEMIADYRDMLGKAMTGFGQNCVLIIGYSFGDMDIGAELFTIRKQRADIPWYAVFPRNDPQVRAMYSKRWQIEQINATFEEFWEELDNEIDFLPNNLKHSKKNALTTAGTIQ
jgi:hypothetical protein